MTALTSIRNSTGFNQLNLLKCSCGFQNLGAVRFKTSGSSKMWMQRQANDEYSRRAKADDYRSRAAYKLEEINRRFKLFRPGQTVVDLGFAPGSWSQVAVENTSPNGRVIGVDLLPVQPPRGVSAIQGNFLDPGVQAELRTMLANPDRGRAVEGIVDKETGDNDDATPKPRRRGLADVVISDMCGICPQETGFWLNSINIPYRLANTSGIVARDHATSMDLCDAALVFSISQLRYGGSFVCKFYTGSEDKDLEARLNRVFKKVSRVKPDASRSESREAYFVAQNKKKVESVESVFGEQ